MVSMDALIKKSESGAVKAEEAGFPELAATMRDGAKLFRELRDDLKRVGEGV